MTVLPGNTSGRKSRPSANLGLVLPRPGPEGANTEYIHNLVGRLQHMFDTLQDSATFRTQSLKISDITTLNTALEKGDVYVDENGFLKIILGAGSPLSGVSGIGTAGTATVVIT
jgi:hypothetical protein